MSSELIRNNKKNAGIRVQWISGSVDQWIGGSMDQGLGIKLIDQVQSAGVGAGMPQNILLLWIDYRLIF